MTIAQMQDLILQKKREKNALVLAHSYIGREVSEVADFTGDSYALARFAEKAEGDVILCGVRFMAETIKILSPETRVFLANEDAGCPMAEQLDEESLSALKAQYPNAAVVAYINSTARLKTLCDVCVTSSSAEKIIKSLPEKEILFVPDINLGSYLAQKIPEKQFHFVHGGCPTHVLATPGDVKSAKKAHPNALLLVHPECRPEVVKEADYVGSTSGIMNFAKMSGADEFIIGTELTIAEHLRYECPSKRFYPLCKDLYCHNMRLTSLSDVLACLNDERKETFVPENVRLAAKKCIDRMISLGG